MTREEQIQRLRVLITSYGEVCAKHSTLSTPAAEALDAIDLQIDRILVGVDRKGGSPPYRHKPPGPSLAQAKQGENWKALEAVLSMGLTGKRLRKAASHGYVAGLRDAAAKVQECACDACAAIARQIV